MDQRIKEIILEVVQRLKETKSINQLEQIEIKIMGKKGAMTEILRSLKDVAPEDRPMVGKAINDARTEIEGYIAEKRQEILTQLEGIKLKTEKIDVTMPGKKIQMGNIHPLIRTINEVKSIFIGLGYEEVDGPEIELSYYNFDALNTPENHPARDLQDTFYITEDILLRTQTSPMQVRTMENRTPPLKIIAPGRVYRPDSVDASHSPLFHQMEGMAIDTDISFGDLKGTLITFCKEAFGEDRSVRFRPHNFPFTEPSAEVDISCIVCNGKGCRLCSHTGWLEILGAGMIHPKVLEMAGYDSAKLSGFAFGLGMERICMLKYGMDDIRAFYENDIRFLGQFR